MVRVSGMFAQPLHVTVLLADLEEYIRKRC